MIHDALRLANIALYGLLAYFGMRIAYEMVTWHRVPNIRTAPGMRQRMIALLRNDQALSSAAPYTVIDLGSGNGQLTWHIARAMPDARVIGVELSHLGHMRSILRQRLRGPANVVYDEADFLTCDVTAADAIVLFLSAKAMPLVEAKLAAELKPGAMVLSNSFALGGDWQPVEKTRFWSLFYIDTALFVYRKAETTT